MYPRLTACYSILLFILLAAGCQGAGKDSSATLAPGQPAAESMPSDTLPKLALPGDLQEGLAADRGTSYVLSDLTFQVENFDPLLPNQNVTAPVSTGSLDFAPAYEPGGAITGLAYATFLFDIDGYDLDNKIHLFWTTPPLTENVWIGLADWDKNRWRFYRPVESISELTVPSLSQYFDAEGRLLLVTVLTGSEMEKLNSIRIGTPRPQVVVDVTGSSSAFGELTTTFDASATESFGGELTYAWDFDSDGVYDEDTGSVATAGHTFTEVGTHTVTVRATDTETLLTGVGSTNVSVAGSWSASVGTAYDELVTDVQAAPDGTIWACGSVLDGSHYLAMSLLHYGADGTLLDEVYWAASSAPADACLSRDLEITEDGKPYVLGTLQLGGDFKFFLQGWSASAELEWMLEVDNTDYNYQKLRWVPGYLCVVGETSGVLYYHGLISLLTEAGSPLHNHLCNESSSFSDVVYRESIQIGESGLYICGHSGELSPIEQDLQVVKKAIVGPNGSAHLWGSNLVRETGIGIGLNGFVGDETVIIGTQYNADAEHEAGLVQFGANDAVSYRPMDAEVSLKDVAIFAQGAVLVDTVDDSYALLQVFGGDRTFELARRYSSGVTSMARAGAPYFNGGVLVGGNLALGGGDFSEESVQVSTARSSSWTESAVEFSAISNPWTDFPVLDNHSTLGPGVQNSGGGGIDAWVSLQALPAE